MSCVFFKLNFTNLSILQSGKGKRGRKIYDDFQFRNFAPQDRKIIQVPVRQNFFRRN
jgi:hypothetical protein